MQSEDLAAKFNSFARELYGDGFIPLHAPTFGGREKDYLNECIDSTFVSSVGKFVDRFEEESAAACGAKHAVAVANGTAALHMAMLLAGVRPGDLVITQALTFVATANAISYINAEPVFLDSAEDTLGLCPTALADFLEQHTSLQSGETIHKASGKRISAIIPMHTFGMAVHLNEIRKLSRDRGIAVVEDAAEAVGSKYLGKPIAADSQFATLSFNGNKVVTCGGGGAILVNDSELYARGKHLTTTAKVPHAWEFNHDQVAYNYRLPNINAALGVAQLEQLSDKVDRKRAQAQLYREFFADTAASYIEDPAHTESNKWLHAIRLPDRSARDQFLKTTNEAGVMTRPAWTLMHKLPMYSHCITGPLTRAEQLEDTIVCIPSTPLAAKGG